MENKFLNCISNPSINMICEEEEFWIDIQDKCRRHILAHFEAMKVIKHPFYHAYVEDIFPKVFFDIIASQMVLYKNSDHLQDRYQDSQCFRNKRFSLFNSKENFAKCLRAIFSDHEIKKACLSKFFISPSFELIQSLSIHNEFEFFFTKASRFQNIHLDIPPKFLSFVFYMPVHTVTLSEEKRNATILYDKSLNPHYSAFYRSNSVCIFAPHFNSYHGFSSTIDRDVLVMFYVNSNELENWQKIQREMEDVPPFTRLLDAIERKVMLYPLIELGNDEEHIFIERSSCLVNSPQGRVIRK